MPHNIPLITTMAVGLGLALILGFVAVRLKLPALVGYLVAGIIIGPSTPGFVADIGSGVDGGVDLRRLAQASAVAA